MKTRPILMNGPMVRAVLSGQKTQTRRLVKDASDAFAVGMGETVACPYGQPGDRLWVRETIRCIRGGYDGVRYWDEAVYAADGAKVKLDQWDWQRDVLPAIHCPRGLSRITLEVVSVRVERLQEITEADAIAEGVIMHTFPEEWQAARARVGGPNASISFDREPSQALIEELGLYDVRHYPARPAMTAVQAFERLWESINGPGSWAANPWVWRVEFKRATDDQVIV